MQLRPDFPDLPIGILLGDLSILEGEKIASSHFDWLTIG
jgi:hypothetical protein